MGIGKSIIRVALGRHDDELVSEDLYEFPALLLRNRLGLDDADFIANSGFAFFIVGIELLGTLDNFLKAWVWDTVRVFYNDGFIHGCGDNNAYAGLTDAGCFSFRFAHDNVI